MPIEIAVAFFLLMNLIASVLYLLMAFFPRASITRRIMGSCWSMALPALIHTSYLLLWIALQPPALIPPPPTLTPQAVVEWLARALSTPTAIVAVWNHMVAGDVVVARWAYFDAQERSLQGWRLAASILLIGLFGPVGLMAYLLLSRSGYLAGMRFDGSNVRR